MDMINWAEREVQIACERENPNLKPGEWDYGCACYESALKAYKTLAGDGHSGMSISITRQILNRMLLGKPLTPIVDTPDIWRDCGYTNRDGAKVYQCARMSSLFKDVYPDGRITYNDNDKYTAVDINNHNLRWKNGLVSKIIHELFPVTMPYAPSDRPIEVFVEEFLTDPKNGDFDTIGILYAKDEEGKETMIHRYFKAGEKDWEEIDCVEYNARRLKAKKRQEDKSE